MSKQELDKMTCISLRLYDRTRNSLFLCRHKKTDAWNLPSVFITGEDVNIANPIDYIDSITTQLGITPQSAVNILLEKGVGVKKSTGEDSEYTLIIYEMKYSLSITDEAFIERQLSYGDCTWKRITDFKKMLPTDLTLSSRTLQRVMKEEKGIM